MRDGHGRRAPIAAFALILALFSPLLAETAFAVLGGYVLFWFAFNVPSPRLAAIGQRTDISYGLYLYAWPVQNLLIWLSPGISPWLLAIETTVIAGVLALGSWHAIEKPFLALKSVLLAGIRTGPPQTEHRQNEPNGSSGCSLPAIAPGHATLDRCAIVV